MRLPPRMVNSTSFFGAEQMKSSVVAVANGLLTAPTWKCFTASYRLVPEKPENRLTQQRFLGYDGVRRYQTVGLTTDS